MWSKANENRTKQLWACMRSLGLLVGWGGWGKRQAVYARRCQSDFPCRPRRNHCHGQRSSGHQRAAGHCRVSCENQGRDLRCQGPWEVVLFFFLTGRIMSPWAAFFSSLSLAVRACPPALFDHIQFLSDHLHGTQVVWDVQAYGSCL